MVEEWWSDLGEASTKFITAALPYQPCSYICRLFAREDSKHVVQIVGLREIEVDNVDLLLEVTLPLYYLSVAEKEFILLSNKYNGLRYRQRAITSLPLHDYKM